MAATTNRSSNRHRLSAVPADLDAFAAAVFDGFAIEVETVFGRCYAVRANPSEASVAMYGSGGGFVNRRNMSKPRLKSYLNARAPDDPLVRRGSIKEVWPL